MTQGGEPGNTPSEPPEEPAYLGRRFSSGPIYSRRSITAYYTLALVVLFGAYGFTLLKSGSVAAAVFLFLLAAGSLWLSIVVIRKESRRAAERRRS